MSEIQLNELSYGGQELNSSHSGYDGQEEAETVDHSVEDFPGMMTEEDTSQTLERLQTLSREISRRTSRDGDIAVDPRDFDLYNLLEKVIVSSAKQGIKECHAGVSFEELSVYGKDETYSIVPTVGDILKGPYTVFKAITSKKVPDRAILHEINGLARSGEMVLVLGRPGAGCSTMLKALSATDRHLYTRFEGEIKYDNVPLKEMVKTFKSDLIYCPELDTHFPHLTVAQTLRFAIASKAPAVRINGASREKYIEVTKDVLNAVFGLGHVEHTKVGNDLVRGVSGGERKRVSIAEALSCRGSIYCWDNATRGLDASTALEYTRAVRTATNLLKHTAFVAIYQAGENVYNTFDKVTVLYSGRQIYFGPVTEAKAYFENMGFICPARQATAEFLTAITDPIGRFPKAGYEDKVPRTAEDFERYWQQSDEYKRLKQEIDEHNKSFNQNDTLNVFRTAKKQDTMRYQRPKSKYTVNYTYQLKLCFIRGLQNIWGDKAYTLIQIIAAISQGLIAGSLYYNTPGTVSGAFSRGGVIFFSTLYVSLMGLAQVSASFSLRPILMKQKNYSMYHPSAEAIASALTSVPVALIVSFFFVVVIYFLSNLAVEAGKFFICWLFVFLLSLTMSAMFEAVASLNKTIATANAFAGVLVLASLMYSSYMIQRPSMHPWFKWISYINPILYAFEAVVSSEFHGRKMECDGTYLVPTGPGYTSLSNGEQACAFKGSVPGQSWVSGDSYISTAFSYSFSHVWRNLGILIGFLVFFNFVKALGMELVKPISGGGDKLLFLRGPVPSNVVLPTDIDDSSDIENQSSTSKNLEKFDKGEDSDSVFEDLKSKDMFTWKDVNYVVKYDGEDRTLLDSISGYCVPGTLTALMGESGAGKTTLLNALAQRLDTGIITGDMLVNGKPLDLSFSRRTGYVQQQDIHLSDSTVREALQFAARMRRSRDTSDQEKLEYVEKIIKALEMELYADSIVGQLGNGLNVEQRKKLSIGVELVSKPSLLLFLDEPTSGLDSQSAWSVVRLLTKLSNAGQSILCTIHQPSATLFEQFDRLLLLRKGGQTVYFGDIGEHSRTILDYFERNGARKSDDSENPAEYILEAIGAGATAVTDRDWFSIWNKSPEKKRADIEREELIEKYSKNNNSSYSERELKQMSKTYASPFWYQFVYLLRRNALTFWRTPEYIAAKTFLMTFSGLFIGFTFFGLKSSLTGMQNASFAGFLTVVVSAPVINQIQEHAMKSRDLYEGRERFSKTYHWSLMIIVQAFNEYPYLVFGASLMFVSLYFPTQADTSGPHAGVFYLTESIFLQTFVITFGLLILFIAPDLPSAAILTSFFYTFIVAFSGIVQPVHLMPGFWTFMNKVSPYTYFIQNLVSTFLHDRKVICDDVEFAYFNPPKGQTCEQFTAPYLKQAFGYIANPDATSQCRYCTFKVGDEYLSSINASYSYIWRNVGFFCVYAIFNLGLVLVLYWFFRVRQGPLLPSILSLPFLKKKSKSK
ncbi:uncharacterized protein PRCAT00005108001 [Priceomyces carsonii]|uniref:uncharacterized protein n=1 Tax=Priceomyces carsonii TaxID=28549 RepID=UPI002ED89728|nr:unnamed protein product [Priceomyces carsonii]